MHSLFTNLFCFSVSELHYGPALPRDSWKIKKTLALYPHISQIPTLLRDNSIL